MTPKGLVNPIAPDRVQICTFLPSPRGADAANWLSSEAFETLSGSQFYYINLNRCGVVRIDAVAV